ncbi:hypothetical protein OVA29_17970 [Exiguobacterium sp. SL14]|nr:hypothetical protein [Exiguobacterium sp. SL14]MCY1692233.1 hypothetical protein [Exiguobacterium sp. SL14]
MGGADSSKYAMFSFAKTKEAKWLFANAQPVWLPSSLPIRQRVLDGLYV